MRVICNAAVLSLILILSPFAFGKSSRTEDFILTIESVKHSVVPVVCGKLDEKGQFSVQLIDGTGFFIDRDGRFLTAAHVINDLKITAPQHPVPCFTVIYIPNDGWQRDATTINARWFKFEFDNCVIDGLLDLAVCKTTIVPPGVEPLIIDDSRPPDGYPVAFTGFPLGSVEPLSSRCDVATYRNATDKEGSRELVLDKGTWPGASGSPIYDEWGNVLGILLQRGIADGIGITVGRPSHFILMFLHQNGVAVETGSGKHKHKK